jgi:hypothetical protein
MRKASELKGASKSMYKSMTEEQLKHLAATKRKGKPKRLLGERTALSACLVMWFDRRRPEKPRVSAFTSADIPKILALERGFVLSFSDLQAEIAAQLIRAGIAAHALNQRDIAGILAMIRSVGAFTRSSPRAMKLGLAKLRRWFVTVRSRRFISKNGPKPKVYFEEWE